MKIGPDNYQEWALDYIEGNLSREERASFESFLTRHADIAREIASLQDDMPVMVAEQIVYPDKRSLLRGGKTMSFGRITSFLGGAAAASLLIGLFTLVDSHSSQKEQLLADRAKEVFREELPAEQDEWTASESAGGSEEKPDIPQLAAAIPQRAASGNRIALRTNVPTTSRTNAQAVQPERIQPLSELIGSEPQLIAPTREPIALAALKTGAEVSGTPDAKTQAGAEKSAEPKKFNLISLFAPFDPIIPIKTYRTENEHGIEIASILRIGNKIQKTEAHD